MLTTTWTIRWRNFFGWGDNHRWSRRGQCFKNLFNQFATFRFLFAGLGSCCRGRCDNRRNGLNRGYDGAVRAELETQRPRHSVCSLSSFCHLYYQTQTCNWMEELTNLRTGLVVTGSYGVDTGRGSRAISFCIFLPATGTTGVRLGEEQTAESREGCASSDPLVIAKGSPRSIRGDEALDGMDPGIVFAAPEPPSVCNLN